MKLELDPADIRPIVDAAVDAAVARLDERQAKLNGRIGYTEAEAAAALGLPRHVLRDARLRGEIQARKVGKRHVYAQKELENFLTP